MKSHSNQTRHKIKSEHLVEQMELPKDIFLGMPLLSMEGNRTLCIVNHRGIIKYCPEVIGIATQSYHIRIVRRVCPSGNIRRILSKFPDICRRSHFCHDRKVSSIRQWQSFGLCMRKQHFPFFKFMCTSRNYVLEDTAGFSDAGFFLYPVAGSV